MPSKEPERKIAEELLHSKKRPASQQATVAAPSSPDAISGSDTEVATDSMVGTMLGGFRIISVLGQGAFGKVYKAQDVKLKRDVAIKMLIREGDGISGELFAREAQAIAALSSHPNIVDIYQWGEHEGKYYFVLAYVPRSAGDLIEEHPDGLPLADALNITATCADALTAAHTEKIFHRDIKPDNILIDAKDQPKLADFGLASQHTSEKSEFTLTGTISGSPPYMSPEQAIAAPLDARSDIYSLGVTLYQFLCGELPCTGESALEIMEKIKTNDRVPLAERRPMLRKDVVALVDKATAFRPGDRYQTAEEFARKLRAVALAIERGDRIDPLDSTFKGESQPFPWKRASAACVLIAAVVLGMVFRPGKDAGLSVVPPPPNSAAADLNAGEYAKAIAGFDLLLLASPNDAQARYGRGLALLFGGDRELAKVTFAEFEEDDPLRSEGMAALAFAEDGANARAKIEQAAETAGTTYADVLVARLDFLESKYSEVVDRLNTLTAKDLLFTFQYEEGLRARGQAYYHLEDLEAAQRIFQRLEESGASRVANVGGAYLQLIANNEREVNREKVLELAGKIRGKFCADPYPRFLVRLLYRP